MELNRKKSDLIAIKVWDPLTRFLHWWIAIAVLLQFATGTIFWLWGSQISNSMMFDLNLPHFYIGYSLATAIAVRITLLFIGPETAHWSDFLPVNSHKRSIWKRTLSYYKSFCRADFPRTLGHNTFAGPVYLVFYLLMAVQVGIGIYLSFLPGGTTQMDSPWMTVHKYIFFALIGFILAHLIAVLIREIKGKEYITSSMINGYKIFSQSDYDKIITQRLKDDVDS